MICRTPDCRRATRRSSSGIVAVHCDDCTRRILRDAFGEQSWWAKARAGKLPPSITGGVPA